MQDDRDEQTGEKCEKDVTNRRQVLERCAKQERNGREMHKTEEKCERDAQHRRYMYVREMNKAGDTFEKDKKN